jgi:hypothetical protein
MNNRTKQSNNIAAGHIRVRPGLYLRPKRFSQTIKPAVLGS